MHSRTSGHRYHYFRFDGSAWRVHLMAQAGRALYAGERHYKGLDALDPHDLARAFISTDVHPAIGCR